MKIGLALGSGGARGWAHLGIIEGLKQMGIQIDVVSGCSIGAYVGAALASDKINELQDWAFELTEWQVLSLLRLGIRRGGLANSSKVFDKLSQEFCAPNFEDMTLPFAITTTDLFTGKEVVFNSGPVGNSIKASCAIPGLFQPVRYQNRWLVDGAVVNPVPVNLCRQLGADFVIAVNLSAGAQFHKIQPQHNTDLNDFDGSLSLDNLFNKWQRKSSDDDMPSIMTVMSNCIDIMQTKITKARLGNDDADFVINMNLHGYNILDFYRSKELHTEGLHAIYRLADQLRYQMGLH